MKKHIGITIGPIFETLNLTSSPVALWASSYIFSLISKTICEKLTEDGVDEKDIITPYYEKNADLLNKNNGVGLFHDRIIFNAENYDISRIKNIRDEAVKYVADQFGIDSDYLKEYVMVAAAEFEADNPILESGKILDSFELATPFVEKEEKNHILALFTGNEYSKNSELKGIPAVTSLSEFQLKKEGKSFKALDDIVRTQNSSLKKFGYYAIVRSDGDNMSKIISDLGDDESKIRDFSRTCLEYCSAAAEVVKKYNGVTIYSGGDDLLAILPCESADGKTPFDFVDETNAIFNKSFEKYNQPVSLSFGITMAFHKFPLYEALEDSQHLLFDIAKQDEKNRVAIRLQKHSGQSAGLLISNDKIPEIAEFLKKIKLLNEQKDKNKDKKDDNADEVLFSALHKIALFEKAFNGAKDAKETKNLFLNIFDAGDHEGNDFLHQTLPDFYGKFSSENGIKALDDIGIVDQNTARAFGYVLRILKFFFEKGGEEH